MGALRICEGCNRHVFVAETRCPFCDRGLVALERTPVFDMPAGLSRSQRLVLAAALLGMSASTCADDPEVSKRMPLTPAGNTDAGVVVLHDSGSTGPLAGYGAIDPVQDGGLRTAAAYGPAPQPPPPRDPPSEQSEIHGGDQDDADAGDQYDAGADAGDAGDE